MLQKMNYFVWHRVRHSLIRFLFVSIPISCAFVLFLFSLFVALRPPMLLFGNCCHQLSVLLRVNCKLKRIYLHILRIAEERSNGAPATNVLFTFVFQSHFQISNGKWKFMPQQIEFGIYLSNGAECRMRNATNFRFHFARHKSECVVRR